MRFIIAIILVLLASACSPRGRGPAQFQQTDEVLINVGIPLKTIEREVQKLASESPIIKKIDLIRLDPETRILSVKGVIHYPLDKLFNFGVTLPSGAPKDHSFEIAVEFPDTAELTQIRYFRLKFHRLTINGSDYLAAFSIGASVIQTIMANSELVHYVFDQASSQIKDPDAMTMMREIIATNGFVVNETNRTIAVKLNLSYFKQFAVFDEIKDLKLWYFGPDLLGGTRQYQVFRLIAGIGKPSDFWLTQHMQNMQRDQRTIEEVKRDLYAQFGQHQAAALKVENYFKSLLKSEALTNNNLSPRYQQEIQTYFGRIKQEASKKLNLENELFKADPESEYLSFLDTEETRARALFADLLRRINIDDLTLRSSDPQNKKLPILTKRIGQDALMSAMNYVRDIETDGQYYVKDAALILAPQIPGLIIRGKINIDLNKLLGQMNAGFIGKKFSTSMLELNQGLPFEMTLETRMGKDGVMGIDPRSIKLMEGERQLRFDRTTDNHRFFLDFVKVYLAQSLAALSIDLTEDTEDPVAKKERLLRELLTYLQTVQGQYNTLANIDDLHRVLSTDIQKNPFNTAGAEYIKKKGQILLSQMISYDDKDKLFKIKLDPKLVAENIQGTKNQFQIWNVAPIVSQDLNNTFLELTLGEGPRGRSYLDALRLRDDAPDQASFSGLYNDNDRSAVDLLASLNFRYLEQSVNQILQEMLVQQNGAYTTELLEDKEQTHYVLNTFKLEIREPQKIFIKLNASVITKKKKFLSWVREEKWKIEEDAYALSAEMSLNQRQISQLRSQLRNDALPIYFNDEAIGLIPHRVSVEFGKPSLINLALGKLTNLNLDAPLINKFRSLLLKLVAQYFSSQHNLKPGEKRLAGHEIEALAKVMTTKDEVLLLLNPRLSGPAFELKLSGKEKFLANSLKLDSKNQELHIALTSSAAMAKIDKREMLNVLQATDELFAPYLKIKDAQQLKNALNKDLFVDRAVRNSDESKLSLYNRILTVMRRYDPVLNTVDIPFRAKNAEQRLTSCGVELMYFAGLSYILHSRLDQLIKKIEQGKVQGQVTYFTTLVEARQKLQNSIVRPLMDKYVERYQIINAQVIKHPTTHWTYQFAPDAYFAEAVYQALVKRRALTP